MNLSRTLAAVTATVALMGASTSSAQAADSSASCQEDQSCFVWSKMGNLKRGVALKSGKTVVVTACRFQRLSAAGKLAPNYVKLKGDRYALRYGCGFDVLDY